MIDLWTAGPHAADWLAARALEAAARDEPMPPAALLLLLRRYRAGALDAAEPIGRALAQALDREAGDPPVARSQWLLLFGEAAAVSDDPRIPDGAAKAIDALRASWPAADEVEPFALSIDACLTCAGLASPPELVARAIDELERLIGAAYRPGAGIAPSLRDPVGVRRLADQVRTASALLTAYGQTDRLPYAMLAEELVQFARRTLWDGVPGAFAAFVSKAEAARVLCRLAALHRSPEYRSAAVIAEHADYAADAARTLETLDARYRDHGLDAAIYGIAVMEWHALEFGGH